MFWIECDIFPPRGPAEIRCPAAQGNWRRTRPGFLAIPNGALGLPRLTRELPKLPSNKVWERFLQGCAAQQKPSCTGSYPSRMLRFLTAQRLRGRMGSGEHVTERARPRYRSDYAIRALPGFPAGRGSTCLAQTSPPSGSRSRQEREEHNRSRRRPALRRSHRPGCNPRP